MTATRLMKLGNEVFTVFCTKCKCCLANGSHCGTCHTKKSIEQLCGCGDCQARALDYFARESEKRNRRAAYKRLDVK